MRSAWASYSSSVGGLAPVRVEVLDIGVPGERPRASGLGGADRPVVAELVRVALVEDFAGPVDAAVLVDVPTRHEAVSGVRTTEHPWVAEVVRADNGDAVGQLGRGGLEPPGVEVEVIGAEEQSGSSVAR